MDTKNLITAMVLSALILVGYQYLYVKPQAELYKQQVLAQKTAEAPKPGDVNAPAELRDRADIIKETQRVAIVTLNLDGSIDLKGARLDDLSLVQYRETTADNSPEITLLTPSGSAPPHSAYYADFSWLSDNKDMPMPTAQTEWKADGTQLTPEHPVKLTWDNGQGLLFERMIAVDDKYMFTLTDHVTNKGGAAVTLYPFGLVARQGNPVVKSISVLHEGPLGVLDGTLQEYKYKKLMEIGKHAADSVGGWFGITDKYWLVAMIPPNDEKLTVEFAYNGKGQTDPSKGYFQTDFRGAGISVAANGAIDHVTHLFAGAKQLRLLDQYSEQYTITHLDRAIDFGWFYFLTKPFLYLLTYLGHALGSVGIAILVFTVMLKLITLPLSLKSYHSMAKMKALQPEMKRLQERYTDDKPRQSQEMMELYKREKVSPLSGCLPTVIQIPIFFALYKVLYVAIEMRQAPFYGWIQDLSSPDPTSVLNAFGMLPVTLPNALHIGVWPILMGCSMFLQQRLSPQPPDKTQARMFMFMPLMFTYMLASMPAGLVIYWTWSNLLGIVQQWFIMRQDLKRKG